MFIGYSGPSPWYVALVGLIVLSLIVFPPKGRSGQKLIVVALWIYWGITLLT